MGRDSAIIRPIRAADLEPVLELTRRGGTGLTDLPPDRDAIQARAASFGYAALGLGADDDEVRWVTDPVRAKPWTPRL